MLALNTYVAMTCLTEPKSENLPLPKQWVLFFRINSLKEMYEKP